MQTKNSKRKKKGVTRVGYGTLVRPQPDQDFEALKACCKALESCSCHRMRQANWAVLNSKYALPGVA